MKPNPDTITGRILAQLTNRYQPTSAFGSEVIRNSALLNRLVSMGLAKSRRVGRNREWRRA